jgi:hypothetical protein
VQEEETVMVPSNAAHGFRNLGTFPARMLVVVTPRHEAFFQAAGRAVNPQRPPGPATPGELTRVVQVAVEYETFVD